MMKKCIRVCMALLNQKSMTSIRFDYTCINTRRVSVLALVALLSVVSLCATAQESSAINHAKKESVDSLLRVKEKQNSDNLSDLKSDRDNTKAKAKEAKRVERNANDAARESDIAYRSELRAQKARKKANKQAKKAARARVQSDND